MHTAGIVSLHIFVHSYHKCVRTQSGLNLDFGHFSLVHAQCTKRVEFSTQQGLRKEVRDVVFSPDKLDSQLTVFFDVVTVFEESHLHVLVFAERLRVVRSEDRSQVAAVQW